MASSRIATAYVLVRPSMEGVAAEVRNKFQETGKASGSAFGSSMVGKLKTIIASAAIGKFVSDSLTAGGALQQSLGGVETLFKGSADKVIANAEQAYRTVGMSANGYMEQVTGFSASLLQSLGNDTATAADVADMAMQDMSDNANKMGTSMESITTAYQGFAKQNYTMLDNLKLGYGGTKTEMERLLQDAQRLTGVKYDITNLSDVYNAIHAIQGELGITGTTAKEASETLAGSASAMKAAFQDVLGNLSLGRAIQPSLNALSSTVSTYVVGNLTPMCVSLFSAIPGAMLSLVSGTFSAIERDLNARVPGLGDAFRDLEAAILVAGAAYAGFTAQKTINSMIKPIAETADLMRKLGDEVGKAAMNQGTLNNVFDAGEVVIGVLTGQISRSTAAEWAMTSAQTALNAVMNANPIALVVAGVAALGIAIGKSIHDINELAKSFEIQAETSEAARAHLAELTAQLETYERNPNKRTRQEREEYAALEKAIEATKQQIVDLQQAEAEAAAAAAAAAADPVNIFNAATEQYAADATSLYETFVSTYEGMFDQVSGWFGPFEKASTSVTTSVDEMIAAMQSQIDFNNDYAANLQILSESGLGTLSSALQASGKDGAAYAAAIVSALEEAGGATTVEGQRIIQQFQELSSGIEQSQSGVAESMTLMNGDFETALSEITETYSNTIEGLDMAVEAQDAARSTFRGFRDGINSESPGIQSAMETIGQMMTKSLQRGIGTVIIPMQIEGYSGHGKFQPNAFHAGGLDYVPFDNYIAALHRGEMVLTSYEADAYRHRGSTENSGGRQVSVVQNIYSQAKTAADLMQEARYQAERAVILGV